MLQALDHAHAPPNATHLFPSHAHNSNHTKYLARTNRGVFLALASTSAATGMPQILFYAANVTDDENKEGGGNLKKNITLLGGDGARPAFAWAGVLTPALPPRAPRLAGRYANATAGAALACARSATQPAAYACTLLALSDERAKNVTAWPL